jgi:putative tricarboxylic transport membrane protein
MAGILAYVIATPLLGFPLATAAFIVGFMVVAGARRAPAIGLTALLGTVGLLYAFIKLVYLPFPKGAGAF